MDEKSKTICDGQDKHTLNNSPIVGIVTQLSDGKKKEHGQEFIAASYIKFIESAGARVVPIVLQQSEEHYEQMFNSINGLLLPGGDPDLLESEVARVSKIFYKLAIKANDEGDVFPIWGTCWGFQFLMCIACNKDILVSTPDRRLSRKLIFQPGYEQSKLFRMSVASEEIVKILSKDAVAFNNHKDGVTPEVFKKYGLEEFYQILTTNHDENGEEYISMLEAHKYPFYGSQWHPEVTSFEFSSRFGPHLKHSLNAVRASQYMANFFVNEARKNHHCFKDEGEERAALIYNHTPVYTGDFVGYAQCYFFKTPSTL
ncbi:gamma-glutamyl hydrolase-like [Ptychodera flava]|uniref:gamma-glutamyl hydrolase-like n=1 Tax=Ptychodera flava TaxID=63121 RepID=UPI00396A5F3E